MRRQNKQAGSDHLGRRLTAAALAVVMGAGCVTLAPFQAQAEGTGDTGYEIYPNPHVINYTGGEYIVKTQVNVVFETGIDQYTKDRLDEVLELKNITSYTTSESVVSGKTNILVGIEGSGEYVDTYADGHLTVTTENLFNELDSYVLDNQNGVITVLGKDTDAAFYGLTSLYHVFTQMDSYTIQEFHMEDWADVASRGFIEGYYGNPWSTEDRQKLMTWGGYYKLNSYFYAPKDDPKHNAKWRELYTQEELDTKIKTLAEAGNASKCRFVYALHPFMHNAVRFNTDENYQADLAAVQAKFAQVIEVGVRQIAILADDAGNVGSTNYVRFLTDMSNWLVEMQKAYPDLKTTLPFCTVEYMGWGESYYAQFPENVQIVMTGGKVWGEVTDRFTSSFTNTVGRGPYMWINWPCTDNSKKHLIMGGYTTFLHTGVNPDNIQGIVLNPMQQSEPSKVAIFGNACYSWNIWETQAEADKAWDASFACVDHNTVIPNDASNALRELSKHMINQNMDSRVTALQESVDLMPILNDFKDKLAAGTVTVDDVDTVMAEFELLQEAAKTYRAKAGNTDVKDQIVYWLDCWDDTTEAAIAYLNGVKAILIGNTTSILQYNTQGKTAFDRSKTHAFWYLDHNEYAEVGVQRIVPFINTLATYVSKYAETAMDPNKVIATFVTNRSDNGVNGTDKALDGKDDTFVSYQATREKPNSEAGVEGGPTCYKGDYVGVTFNKVIPIHNIRFLLGNGKNHFEASKLQYTRDGKKWLDLELTGMDNAFTGVRNEYLEVVVEQGKLPENFQAMGIRLVATANNTQDAYLNVHEIQINKEESNEPQLIEGEFSTSDGLRVQAGAGGLSNLKDGNNGTETWLSNPGNKVVAGAYIQYTFTKATQIGTVHFAQGSSKAGDVITNGKLKYQSEDGAWHDAGDVTNAKDQSFDFNGQGIMAKAIRIYNSAEVPVWWRAGEFTVTEGTGSSDKPIEYHVSRTGRWSVVGGNEANLYDGNDSSYVYYDPDGGRQNDAPPQDTFAADEYLGYDLGKVAELASIHLVVGNSANPGDKIAKYTIETSLTGQDGSWQAVPSYENYTGNPNAVDTLNIELEQPIQARYIRVRNEEPRNKWGYFSEFTVTEVVDQTGSTENLYTNVTTDILSNKEEGMVSLTNGSVTLNNGQYIGVNLGNIKAVTGVTTSVLPAGVKLQTSMNGVTWTDYEGAVDARYVRAVATANSVELNLTEFVVSYEFVGDKSVGSNFANQSGSDMRTAGDVANVFDGKLTTQGIIAGPQEAEKTITFDLGQTIHFESLRYYIAENQLNYPRYVKFEVSEDGKVWTQVLTVGNENFVNEWNDTKAKQASYLTHDPKNPGNMYAEATGLDVNGRYIRVTPQKTYSHRWLAFGEIQINGGAYVSPESNRDIISNVTEEAGKIPSNALDGNYSTTYKPGEANHSFTYRISEPAGLTSIRLVQLGAISNATVTARYVGEDSAVELGTLSQAINEFKLDTGNTLESITVSWTDTIPEIAEIATSTQAVGQVNKDELKAALDATQPTDTWTTDSVKAYNAAKEEAQAIYDNEYATQTMVDAARAVLNQAVSNAKVKAADEVVTDLTAMVADKLSNDQNIYTTVSYNAYATAVSNLENALDDAGNLSAEKAGELKQAVTAAQAALVYSTSNRELAELAVENYTAIDGKNYTTNSYDAVTAAKEAIDELVARDKAAESHAGRVNPVEFIEAKATYGQAVAALVDVTALKAATAQANSVDGNLYTADSYKAYTDAVDAGKALLANGTKEQVANAVADIHAKYGALALKPTAALGEVIAQAKALNGENYTADSYAALMALVSEAEVNGDDSYITQIQDAMDALVNVEALKAQLAAAQAVDGEKYTANSYKYLVERMVQVDALLKSGTQGQVDSMTTTLDSAIRALVARATGVDEYRDGITLKPTDGYTADSYAAYKQAYDALMSADAANLTAEEFAQLKANFEQAELALKKADTNKPGENDKPGDNTDGDKVPPTGDSWNLFVYVMSVAVCVAGISALMFFKSKKKA